MVMPTFKTWVIAALFLALAGSLSWGFWRQGQAKASAVRVESLEADLERSERHVEALEKALARQAAVTAAQTKARKQAEQDMQARRAELEKNDEARPVGTPRQLDSLRGLAEAGNEAIRGAGKLP